MRAYDEASVEPRLQSIVRELEAIRERRPETFQEYEDNEPLRYELEHRLFIICQAVLDIAAHVALRQGLLSMGTYGEALEHLGKARILSPDLSERLAPVPQMRNALAHEYLGLDNASVFRALSELEIIEAFVTGMMSWMDAQSR